MSVCPSVCMSVMPFLPCSLDLHVTYTGHWSYVMLVARTISSQKVKGQGHRCHSKFLSCPLRVPVSIWPICFTLSTNIVHDVTMSCHPLPGQQVTGQDHTVHLKWRSHWLLEVFAASLFCSVPIWLNHFICSIHITHEGTMCHGPFSGWKVKSQGHMDQPKCLVCSLCSSVPISTIHFIWDTNNPWGRNVSRTISRSKAQRSRSHGSFQVCALSTTWLPPY